MKGALIAIMIIFSGYLFLVSPRLFGKPDRSQLKGVLYAHRGLFDNETDAPENSLRAVEKAVENGYGIEFDVQLSKDEVPVVFHDFTLKRMCGVEGKVCDYTVEELQTMTLKDSEQTIPTLEQVLAAVGGKVPLVGNVIEQQFTKASDWNFGAAVSIVVMACVLIFMFAINKTDDSDTDRSGMII